MSSKSIRCSNLKGVEGKTSMSNQIYACLIWGREYTASVTSEPAEGKIYVDNSSRTGGGYIILYGAYDRIDQLKDDERARLTTWLVDQRLQENNQPVITEEIIDYIKNKPALPVHERADRLLRFFTRKSETPGAEVSIVENTPAGLEALAWTESIKWNEIGYYLSYLEEMGWIRYFSSIVSGDYVGIVTVNGRNRIAEQLTNTDSSQAFVAMWFGQETDGVYEQGIRPAIEEAGYKPMRIDRKLDVEKIDDAIIAEIRRSRFLVADFTHGEDGVRGGVYFEAGFAMGLGIPVIFTCRSDMVTKLHFDTRQYAHIVWTTPNKLSLDLRDRILARIGPGPDLDKTAPLRERVPSQPLGQWLVENMPRGINLEIPDRQASERPIPFVDDESR